MGHSKGNSFSVVGAESYKTLLLIDRPLLPYLHTQFVSYYILASPIIINEAEQVV